MSKLVRMRQKAYNKVVEQTDKQYKKGVIGERPSYEKVWEELHNPHSTTLIQKMAVVLLVFVSIFSVFKSISSSVVYANSFADKAGLDAHLTFVFVAVVVIVNALVVSTGLIYTTMQATDKLTLELIAANPLYHKGDSIWRAFTRLISLEAITPRLWQSLTYAVMVWLFIISNQGEGDLVIKNLPVVMEIALAHLVVEILQNWRTHSANVDKVLTLQTVEWDKKYNNRHRSPDYLPILFQNLRESLALMKVWHKRVNVWIDSASAENVHEAVLGEYMWQSAGITFAEAVTQQSISQSAKSAYIVEAVNNVVTEQTDEERVPPQSTKKWTVQSLMQDFHIRNLDPNETYNQSTLDADYKSGYAVRIAYRNGAKDYFKKGLK